ncbi:mariner Mos1 transposase [Trichonephila clavipes]|nr:mariner Mos1 transposase [Trichonephila clavipes]
MKTASWWKHRVADRVDRSECAVRNCSEQWTRKGTQARKTGSGATRKTTRREDRRIVWQALVDPTVNRSTIRADVGVAIVPQTISKHLAEANLKSKRPFRALPLTPEHRQVRLQWCQARSMWNVTDMLKVALSDKSRFVWGTGTGVEAPCQRYIYDILRPHVGPFLNGLPGAVFPQDSARPHTARVAQDFLRHFQNLSWPARSPDLSPVEHVWDQLKRQMPSCHSVHDLELSVQDFNFVNGVPLYTEGRNETFTIRPPHTYTVVIKLNLDSSLKTTGFDSVAVQSLRARIHSKRKRLPAKIFENADLQALLEEDDGQTQEHLAEQLNVDQSTVSRRLKAMGKKKKVRRWVPHKLTDLQQENRKLVCEMLLFRYICKSYLHRILTGKENGFILRIPNVNDDMLTPDSLPNRPQGRIASAARQEGYGREIQYHSKPRYWVQDQCGDAQRNSSTASHHGVSKLESIHRVVLVEAGFVSEHNVVSFRCPCPAVHCTIDGANAIDWVEKESAVILQTGCVPIAATHSKNFGIDIGFQ